MNIESIYHYIYLAIVAILSISVWQVYINRLDYRFDYGNRNRAFRGH